jgi:hypothetical protein
LQITRLSLPCILVLIVTAFSGDSYALHTNGRTKPKIMVHYMAWYSAKPISGYWGWHWTMNHFNPEKNRRHGDDEEIMSKLDEASVLLLSGGSVGAKKIMSSL